MNDIEYDYADVIIGRPQDFRVGRKSFKLYPVTLAKMFLLRRHLEGLGLNTESLKINTYMEALRLSQDNREECCHILALHTAPNTYKDLYDTRAITIRKNYFIENLSDEDLASLLIYVFSSDKTEAIMKHLGLDKEHERYGRVIDVKKDKNTMTFNGLSIFGTLIVPLKEMGYTDNEILYEKSYAFIRLALADKVSTVYLTDEERKNLKTEYGGTLIDGNDPNSIGKVMEVFGNKGITIKS